MTATIHLTINGAPVAGHGTFDVINPATGAPAGQCPAATGAEVDAAVAAANAAYASWQFRPDAER